MKISSPSKAAGGLKAVLSSLSNIKNRTGLIRGSKTALKMNQKEGFDCPGCAWPDPDHQRSMFEFCENGIKAIAEEAMTGKIDATFFAKHSVSDLKEKEEYWLSSQGRLTEPMYLPSGANHYQPIEWNQAFQLISEKLKSLDSPNKAVFYTSGRTSNEAAFLYQLFVRKYGTNNLPDCSNMCHESSGVALSETIGIGKGTVTLDDFAKTDLIFLIGQNPGTNHPRMLSTLQEAARRGAKIITINPLREAGNERFSHPQEVSGILGKSTKLTSLFLPVRINGDVALLKGIMKGLLEIDAELDQKFISDFTTGFEEFLEDLKNTSWESIADESGIQKSKILEASNLYAKSNSAIACWAMGLTQHKNAVANIQEVVNLLLMKGNIGRPGAGVCPVRGHSNVQGDRTMGILEKPKEAFLNKLEEVYDFKPPKDHGYDTVHAIQAMQSGQVGVFFAMGGNFLSATPDTDFTSEAFSKCDLTVHVSTKLNYSHLHTGKEALILPCLGRTEKDQFVTVENSMGIVHKSQGSLEPCSKDLKSEVAICCDLAKHTLDEDWSHYQNNYDNIRSDIEKVIPGFENFYERVRKPGGFYLPNPPRDSRTFNTESGKANFTVHSIDSHNLSDDEFLLSTVRTHDQFNTTVYGPHDRYRGIFYGRRVVLISPADLKKRKLSPGQKIDLCSEYSGQKRWARDFTLVPYEIPKGCLSTCLSRGQPTRARRQVCGQEPHTDF